MIEDLRTLEGDSEFAADICIIGAGAAGITLAKELAGSPHRVLLLESGGLDFEEETQSLYRGDIVGMPYIDLDVTRLRYFGGSTNHWGGYCLPMHDIDFRVRSWVPHSGWALTRDELEPYYRKAAELCALGEFVFDERRWKAIGIEIPPFDREKLLPIMHQLSPPVRFGEAYREDLRKAGNVRVLLHANVVDIRTNAAKMAVDRVEIRTLAGKSGSVRARVFVLACGGIENARLLLNCTADEPHGLGNRHDLVGRFFRDHLICRSVGAISTSDQVPLLRIFLTRWHDRVRNEPAFRISDQVQEREQCLNAAWSVDTDAVREGPLDAAREIWVSLKSKAEWPDELGEKVWRVVSDLDGVALNAYREFVLGQEPVATYEKVFLSCVVEPAPNPDSRVRLSEERDALGLRAVDLDWRTTDLDRHTFLVTAKTAAAELGRLGLARVQLAPWVVDRELPWPELEPGHHHMGTTRMAADPKHGVVQKDCRVHGVDNLYIAGSSVFPTVSHSGTTITIIALAARMADHLKERLA